MMCFESNANNNCWQLELGGDGRRKARVTDNYNLSNGPVLALPETGKSRRGVTCVRQEGNKSSVLARLRLRCLFRHARTCVK